jgi:hypothetical protein
MSRSRHFPLVCAVALASLVAPSAQAIPFLPHDSPAATPNATLVADTCPAGYTLHPRLHVCVTKPACAAGYTLHPRLHLCVAQPTCPAGSTWHPRLHLCVAT